MYKKLLTIELTVVFRWFFVIYYIFGINSRLFLVWKPNRHEPIFDLFGIFSESSPFWSMSFNLISLVASLVFALGINVRWTSFIAGTALLVSLFLDIKNTLQFDYLVCFAFFAFFIYSFDQRKKTFYPLVLLLSSIYFWAAFHKLFNFSNMIKFLPSMLQTWYYPEVLVYCPKGECLLTKFLSFAAIPVELSLFCLVLFKKTRALGFMLALFFHFQIAALTSAFSVSIMKLILISIIILEETGWRVRDLVAKTQENAVLNRILKIIGIISLGIGGGVFVFSKSLFFKEVMVFIKIFLPALIIFIYFVEDRMNFKEKYQEKINGITRYWVVFLFCFGVFPVFSNYSYFSLGWTMFSAGWSRASVYSLSITKKELKSCPSLPRKSIGFKRSIVFNKKNIDGGIQFLSYRPEYLLKFKEFYSELCPYLHYNKVIKLDKKSIDRN